VHVEQVSPQDFPAHGSGQVSIPAVHWPLTHFAQGQAEEPSEQSSHATKLLGQSMSVVHCDEGHAGKTHWHCPLTHSYESVTFDPSGQAFVAGNAVVMQSADVVHIVAPHTGSFT
jgi:hypothetical protein